MGGFESRPLSRSAGWGVGEMRDGSCSIMMQQVATVDWVEEEEEAEEDLFNMVVSD